ncbi:hypothetical protein [Streptomyces albipurpureus]|uniref:50S ribosomal protein L19 n=1 Tax=Streptomyces albipurpureus TaxID=2897419 RepID=A0ABT0UWY9_9ACTN|nr:hypothetical protein [Streptomyces sp. CWNU-1]MCM2392615.1 hypothetical protein [Streptomyces sp. CWNU-1]
MSPIEPRTLIHTALSKKAGRQYGDGVSVEQIQPVPGEPVRLRVQAPDPMGAVRTHLIEIREES